MKRAIVWPILTVMALASLAAVPTAAGRQAPAAPDVWAPLRFFVGSWTGGGEGTPGTATGEETFAFILRGTYLQVRNKAVFDPQAKNPAGEVHEDWGVFSYDKARKTFVLRSFHVEGFVNEYVLQDQASDPKTFVFVSESIENIPAGYRARLTYRIIDRDSFEQTFDLAPAGQEFTCYSKGIMRRQKGEPK